LVGVIQNFNNYFWATSINFNFLGPNLKIKIWGQYVNFKQFEGQIIIFENFEGPICNFLEIYCGQIEIFEKFEDQNANFEKL